MTCAQFRGYLFEIFVSKMLEENGFKKCEYSEEGNYIYQKPCEMASEDGELEGRGTKHQIDFIGIYERNIPFIYPLRILVECKYYRNGVYKNVIREFIGVVKDIDENYFYNQRKERIRFLNIPIIFSATKFHNEAINLAWAHGVSTISYHNIPVLKDFLNELNDFVEKKCGKSKDILNKYVKQYKNEFLREIDVPELQTFLFATTEKGLLINLISQDEFPNNLFLDTDERNCGIYFLEDDNQEENNNRVFYISLHDDNQNRKFYFQANDELMKKGFSNLSLDERTNMKKRYFKKLTIIKKINGIDRIIKLNVDFEDSKIRNILE